MQQLLCKLNSDNFAHVQLHQWTLRCRRENPAEFPKVHILNGRQDSTLIPKL